MYALCTRNHRPMGITAVRIKDDHISIHLDDLYLSLTMEEWVELSRAVTEALIRGPEREFIDPW